MQETIIKIKKVIEKFVNYVEDNSGARDAIDKWIGNKYGKIISWNLKYNDSEENFYAVFTNDDVKLQEGEYPAFDTFISGPPDVILNILTGKSKINTELKRNNIMVWGNLNEGIVFNKIINQAVKMMEGS